MDKHDFAKLRWRCRRGMRELDTLLLAYLEQRYAHAVTDEQGAFKKLLTMPDPEILALLTGRADVDDEHLRNVIERLQHRG